MGFGPMAKLIRRFLKKVRPVKEEGKNDRTAPEPIKEETIITDFLISEQPEKKNDDNDGILENLYQPGMGVVTDPTGIYEDRIADPEHLMGHDVEVKELPETKAEEIDASWIDLEIKRDFKNIIKELETRNVNCYDILSVPMNADSSVIRKSYRTLASRYHPDRGTGIEQMTRDEAISKIRDINYSKEILLDPTIRALYDKMIREHKRTTVDVEGPKKEFDPSLLEFFLEKTELSTKGDEVVTDFTFEENGFNGLGVLFFKKWDEDHEHFSDDFIDYIIQLDESGFVNYGEVLIGDLSDINEIFKLKRISNYSQAVNNTLFEVWALPPFYYMAVPIINRDHLQDICDILKESFGVDSILFDYPKI